MPDTLRQPTTPATTDEFLESVARGLELDTKEAAVYLAALRSGAQSVQAIAAAAQTERTGTYDVLERLARRKYLRIERIGKRGKIVVESPATLRALLAEKLAGIESILPQLLALYDQHTERIAVDRHTNADAVGLLIETLRAASSPIRLLLGSTNLFDGPWLLDGQKTMLTELLVTKRAKVLVGMALSSTAREWVGVVSDRLTCRELSATATVASTQVVTDSTVLTLVTELDELVGIAVSSMTVARHEHELFDVIWRTAKPIA